MNQSRKIDAIGFPPPLMGEKPHRLQVLAETDAWVALDKPAGLAVRDYPWDTNVPSLDAALNVQLKAQKPELVSRGASLYGSVYYLDPQISGVGLFGKNRDSLADLRNQFGSGDMEFRFVFVTGSKPAAIDESFTADAPLLHHNVKPKMIPSTAKGKKCSTDFRMLASTSLGWTLWEAKTTFFRVHQVRAHAAVHALPIMGDTLYGGSEAPTLRELMPKKRGKGLDSVSYSGFAVHLLDCLLPSGDKIESPLPKTFKLLLKRLDMGVFK